MGLQIYTAAQTVGSYCKITVSYTTRQDTECERIVSRIIYSFSFEHKSFNIFMLLLSWQ